MNAVVKKLHLSSTLTLAVAQVRKYHIMVSLAFLGCLSCLLPLATAASVERTTSLSQEQIRERSYGTYDGIVETSDGRPLSEEARELLGPHAMMQHIESAQVTHEAKSAEATGRIFPADDQRLKSLTVVKNGSFSPAPDSLALTEALAQRIGAAVGSEVTIDNSRFTVSAVHVDPQDIRRLGWVAPPSAADRLPGLTARSSYLTSTQPAESFLTSHHAKYLVQPDTEVSYRTKTHGLGLGSSAALIATFLVVLMAVLIGFSSILLKEQEKDFICLHRVGLPQQVITLSAISPLLIGATLGILASYAATPLLTERIVRALEERHGQLWGTVKDISPEFRWILTLALIAFIAASWWQCRRFFAEYIHRRSQKNIAERTTATICIGLLALGILCAWIGSTNPNWQPMILAGIFLIAVALFVLVPRVLPLMARRVVRRALPPLISVPMQAVARSGRRNNGIVCAFTALIGTAVFIHVVAFGLQIGVADYHVSPLDTKDSVVNTTRALTQQEQQRLDTKATWQRGMMSDGTRRDFVYGGSHQVLCRSLPPGSARHPAEEVCRQEQLGSFTNSNLTIADVESASYLAGAELSDEERKEFAAGRLALTKGSGWPDVVPVGTSTPEFTEKATIRTRSFPYQERSANHPGLVVSPAVLRHWPWLELEDRYDYAVVSRPGAEIFRSLPEDQELRAHFYERFRNSASAPAEAVTTWSVLFAMALTGAIATFIVLAWKRQDARNRGVLQAIGCSPWMAKGTTSVMFTVVIGVSSVVGAGAGAYLAWCMIRPTVMVFPPLYGALAITFAPVVAALSVVWLSRNDRPITKRAQA
ncbi:FtsX-like permease family protein [Austwickia chelonae]|uniref:FtsX-like permease family protein n=1 Tax=Austwickia chelonae TaxID=100225 RepID=UPI000E264BE4|nr:FtsX-like permease family protein [Austwickia chelonae]